MLLDVCNVVLLQKSDARSSLERSKAQVIQKVPKMIAKWTPRGAFGSTLELGKRSKHDKRCYFALVFPVSFLDGMLGQILSETASERHGLNRVWTAQARADRI